jgi:hypothetical protein
MNAILVAWGAGVRPGSHVGVVPNVSVAATIAHLPRVDFKEGTALMPLLKD